MNLLTRVRVGFSLFLVAGIVIGVRAACTEFNLLHRNGAVICITFGLAGLLMWLIGGVAESKRKKMIQTEDALTDHVFAEHPLAFLKSLKSWGMILILSAGALLTFGAYRPAKSAPLRPATHRVTNAIPTVSFPRLDLQGVIINGSKSSAFINGRVLYIGEGIGSARVVAIEPDHVIIELEGHTNILWFGD